MQLRRAQGADTDAEHDDPGHKREGDAPSALSAELDSIVNGTHPALTAELEKHAAARDARIAAADRLLKAELLNTNNIGDSEYKFVDDMLRDGLESARQKLYDAVYARYGKPNPNTPQPAEDLLAPRKDRKRAAPWMLAGVQRRRLLPPVQIRYSLSEQEIEADLEALMDEVEVARRARETDDARDEGEGDVLEVAIDKARGVLTCGDQTFERWAPVTIGDKNPNSSVAGDWCITAINPIEVTLRNVDGTRTKVSLAALRSRRLTFMPLGSEPPPTSV